MLFEDTYQTIEKKSEAFFKDKGSKFIGIAIPVYSEQEAKDNLNEIKKKYHDATHHCYAYRLGYNKSAYRINDDGEPSGSAAKPIFNQILSKDLTNIIIVVVRYYGGTNLGIPGLINAYKTSAKDAIENGNIITKIVREVYELRFGYELMNTIMKFIKDEKLEQTSHDYKDDCKILISIRKSYATSVTNKLRQIDGIELKFLSIE
jgi:uncharacterized YigZ family protein